MQYFAPRSLIVFAAFAMLLRPACLFAGDATAFGQVEARVKEYLTALAEGNAKDIGKTFDQNTEDGRATALLFEKVAGVIGENRKLEKAASDKFGKDGALAVQKAFKMPAPAALRGAAAESLRRMEVFIGEKGDTAVAYVPGPGIEYIQLKKVKENWFIRVDKRAAEIAREFILSVEDSQRRFDQATKILNRSATVDEFREGLSKLPCAAPADCTFRGQ